MKSMTSTIGNHMTGTVNICYHKILGTSWATAETRSRADEISTLVGTASNFHHNLAEDLREDMKNRRIIVRAKSKIFKLN